MFKFEEFNCVYFGKSVGERFCDVFFFICVLVVIYYFKWKIFFNNSVLLSIKLNGYDKMVFVLV